MGYDMKQEQFFANFFAERGIDLPDENAELSSLLDSFGLLTLFISAGAEFNVEISPVQMYSLDTLAKLKAHIKALL